MPKNQLHTLLTVAILLLTCSPGFAWQSKHTTGTATATTQSANLDSALWKERAEWKTYFDDANLTGTFVLYDPATHTIHALDRARATKPFIPASTYKILNSLIALETGVVRDENEVLKWDGVKRMEGWNQDHTMRTAFPASVVWFYQELARRIGQERMQGFVDLVGYGNRNIGGGIDKFWLTGDLRMTAVEQIDLLVRLQRSQLPFSSETMEKVRDIMVREKTDTFTLRGKTGWAFDFTPQVGWFVGYLERGDQAWFFALNCDMTGEPDGPARMAVTRKILEAEGLLK